MKRKQRTIQEMLKKKRSNKNDEDINGIKISPYLIASNDITQETKFEVSTMAKVYFRDHSNINEILDRYLEKENITNVNKDDYLHAIIRQVIYYRQRRNYPFNMFKFESDYHESIGKFLLRNFNIQSHEDLREANLFLHQTNIMHCQVSMDMNNKFRVDEQEYIHRKKERIGYQDLKQFLVMGTDHALRQYNQEHKLFQKYNIDEISLEEMCKISTIERLTRIKMEKKCMPESAFEGCLKNIFTALKNNRGLALTLEGFYIFPQYLLITNNLTPEQERTVTERKVRFYAYTNAKDLLAINKRYFPVSDENADPVTKRKERRKLFYLKYIRLIDKKEPPFNNLLWIEQETSDTQNNANDNQPECVTAGPSNSSVWRKKTVTEKGALASQNNEKENIIENRFARNPKDYLAAPKTEHEFVNIIKLLMRQNEIVEEIKNYIVHDSDIATTWEKNSQVILWNFIHFNLYDRNKNFLNLLIKCSSEIREQLDKMLKQANIYADFDTFEDLIPIATSTQTMEPELLPIQDNQQNRPFQSSGNSDDIVNIHDEPSDFTIKKVKQEKYSQPNDSDSDVLLVPLNQTDVISISDEEYNNIDNNRIVPENNGIDVYQQNLNIESQANHESNNTHASLEAEYGLISHRMARQNVTNRRHVLKKNVPSKMVYDSDVTSSNKNAHN